MVFYRRGSLFWALNFDFCLYQAVYIQDRIPDSRHRIHEKIQKKKNTQTSRQKDPPDWGHRRIDVWIS